MKRILLLMLCIYLSACSASHRYHHDIVVIDESNDFKPELSQQLPPIFHRGFTHVDINSDDIFTLTNEQKSDFLRYYNSPRNNHINPSKRVATYINDFSSDFNYMGDTLKASDAIEQKSGNCLSLAIVSTAFAKLANLKYKYKKVHSAPVFQEQGDVQLVSSHLNFTMYDVSTVGEGLNLTINSVTIDYFVGGRTAVSETVPKDEILIMYWHNLASEAIIRKNLDLAFAYTLKANAINPKHPETLNLLAVLYRRIGETELAYEVYEYIVNNKLSTFTSIDNFAALLDSRGEQNRAESLRYQIKHLIDDNPFTWLYRGMLRIENEEFALAEKYFLKSSEIGPYLHEPQFYLARIYARQNKTILAKRALRQAQDLAYLPDDVRRYKAKLYGLENN